MTSWQRLEQVIKWSGMSTNRFALAIGLKRSENLYQIKRGSFGISKELARLITAKYPMINRMWLLTGDGQMLSPHAFAGAAMDGYQNIEGAIPFYDTDAIIVANAEQRSKLQPQYYIGIPALKGCDFAAQCAGGSMAPEIPAGSTVVLKEVSLETLLPGEAYLVVTPDFATIKFVRTVDSNPELLTLVPKNTVDYDAIQIERSKIIKLYLVKTVINHRLM